jgi:beta-glucanase (GH16 family)
MMHTTRKRRLVAFTVAGAAALALGAGPVLQGADPANAASGDVVWSQDFDGAAGSAPDRSAWTNETGGGGWGNNELEDYTDSRDNSALDGQGNLVITAKREADGSYTSARLTTQGKYTPRYGRVEARIQIPRGQGIWPAFWMLGSDLPQVGWPNSGEVDVMENVGYEPATVHGTVHGPGYSGGQGITSSYQHPQGWSTANVWNVSANDHPWGGRSRTRSTRSRSTGSPDRSPGRSTVSRTRRSRPPTRVAIRGSSTSRSSSC